MASSCDVAKKVMRFKLQLSDTAESATVVKILQKLKGLDITLDILAETGIGKTVNSLRRHEKAGEYAKLLVRGWKRLVPKESTSQTEGGEASDGLSIKDKLDDNLCQNEESLIMEDLNNNCLTCHDKSPEEAESKKELRKADSEKKCKEEITYENEHVYQENGQTENHVIANREDPEKRGNIQEDLKDNFGICKKKKKKNPEKSHEENQTVSMNDVSEKGIEFKKGKTDSTVDSKKRKIDPFDRKSGADDTGNESTEETYQKSKSSKNKMKRGSDSVRCRSEKELNEKSKTLNESSNEGKDSLSYKNIDKNCEQLQLDYVRGSKSLGRWKHSDKQNKKRRKEKEKCPTLESEDEVHKRKKSKSKHKEKENDTEEPSMSFESFLNYDVNVLKRKEKSAVKKPQKKVTTVVKEASNDPGLKPSGMNITDASPNQKFKDSVLDLMSIPLPAVLPDFDKPSCFDYYERKVEKEPELCNAPEESTGFTGQRLNKKMQVYSGAKTIFLPAMLSLHQQCIRTLQNNINLLYETGGVPFQILEPVLERCTPEQLLRIEECNPIYVGETDHLWGKHCQRDFHDSKLQEYESWKEMYVRLSEERERKLKRLTKSIVSAHCSKPKGRQVKMAFIHSVAKPPRDVRIQQEIHGTAAQQPQPPRCSVKVQENRPRQSCDEPSRSSSSSSGAGNTPDLRKKTKVAPMMAKSLKAFKKQFGRR